MSKLEAIELSQTTPQPHFDVAVVLHGFGASAADLAPLAGRFGTARRWLFPQAPFPISVGGMAYGRAWFPRTDAEMEEAVYGGYFASLRAFEPAGLFESRDEVIDLIASADVSWDRVLVAGFSQGAMVAAEVLRHRLAEASTPPKSAVLLSGALVAESTWNATNPSATTTRVIQTHGRQDQVLRYAEAEALRDQLVRVVGSVDFVSFAGGHEIPEQVVSQVSDRLGSNGTL